MEKQICKKCKKRPIYREHSENYCFRCYETRRNGSIKYRNAHKEENKERTRKWVAAHPEKVKEYRERERRNPVSSLMKKIFNKEWKRTDAGKASRKRYYEKHKETIKEQTKVYVQNNRIVVKEKIKKWTSKNKEKVCGYVKKYRSNHPEQVTKSSRKRQELFKSVVGNFTLSEWSYLCEKYENRCLWCKRTDRKLTVDHIVPITKGGTNFIDNIQPLCRNCNSKKGNKTIDFRPLGSMVMEWT